MRGRASERKRRYLLDAAHWMLGDLNTAESVVDEAYQWWYGLSGAARRRVAVPRSWLARTVGGICLARLALPTAERVAFVLRTFGMASGTVADIVGRTEPELAELATRARQLFTAPHRTSTTPSSAPYAGRASAGRSPATC
ncbi:hypothetical protein [Streptomyces sp. NPDC002276]